MLFDPHDVEWDDKKISNFWNVFSDIHKTGYFAEQVGEEVLQYVKKHIDINGKIIDYGCGNGYLIGLLLDKKIEVVCGCDYSKDSVEHVNNRYQNNKKYGGCNQNETMPTKFSNNFFNVAFLLETIEHLFKEHLPETLTELNRIITADGYLIITTRNNEDLNDLKVVCPDCGAIFHRVQHINSFTDKSLTNLMKQFGFDKIYCGSTNLGIYEKSFRSNVKKFIRTYMIKRKGFGQNLIYIGKKVSDVII